AGSPGADGPWSHPVDLGDEGVTPERVESEGEVVVPDTGERQDERSVEEDLRVNFEGQVVRLAAPPPALVRQLVPTELHLHVVQPRYRWRQPALFRRVARQGHRLLLFYPKCDHRPWRHPDAIHRAASGAPLTL
ncbi:hypothetical protein OTU49_007188, partial [Cherax quadricarinatus]